MLREDLLENRSVGTGEMGLACEWNLIGKELVKMCTEENTLHQKLCCQSV